MDYYQPDANSGGYLIYQNNNKTNEGVNQKHTISLQCIGEARISSFPCCDWEDWSDDRSRFFVSFSVYFFLIKPQNTLIKIKDLYDYEKRY